MSDTGMITTERSGCDNLTVLCGLEIGPPPSARQLKAAAAFALGQMLAFADVKASTQRKQQAQCFRLTDNSSVRQTTAPRSLAALSQLRQGIAKRRVEEAADAKAPLPKRAAPEGTRPGAAAVSALGRKPMKIVPPPSVTLAPGTAPQLGCHLARGATGPAGRSGTSGCRAAGDSSMSRVYGSRLRVTQLPEDYEEYFVGLDPDPQLDDPDEREARQLLLGGQRRPGPLAPGGVALGMAPDANFTCGAVMTSTGVIDEVSLDFAGGLVGAPTQPQLPTQDSGAALPDMMAGQEATAGGRGLMAPFLPGAPPLAVGMPYSSAPYGVVVDGGGANMVAAARAAAAAAVAPELMLDADDADGSSDDDDDDDDDDGGDMEDQLGSALDQFDPMDVASQQMSQQAGLGTQGYGGNFGIPPGVVGMGGSGEDVGVMTQEDDSAMVEEF